jgi:uncharacterized protein
MERALYNGVNSGMSLAGTLYCYRNPLASNGDKLRNPWYDTTCCPPNIERLFESLPGYFYGTSRDGVYVNLYGNSQLDWHLEDGSGLKLTQSTTYPWAGDIRLTVEPERPSEWTLYLRWPAWASTADVLVNGQIVQVPGNKRGSYIAISRTWNRGDNVVLTLGMQTVPMVSNPRVSDTYGKVAIQRGPLVYALEQVDQGGVTLGDLFIRPTGPGTAEVKKDLLGGVTVLKLSGLAAERSYVDEPLYQPLANLSGHSKRPVTLTFIPYYAIGNREPTPMEVWVPTTRSEEAVSTAASGLERHSDGK